MLPPNLGRRGSVPGCCDDPVQSLLNSLEVGASAEVRSDIIANNGGSQIVWEGPLEAFAYLDSQDSVTKRDQEEDPVVHAFASQAPGIRDLEAYRVAYEKQYWKGTGRLAKIGLPRPLVLQLRRLRALVQNTIGGTTAL